MNLGRLILEKVRQDHQLHFALHLLNQQLKTKKKFVKMYQVRFISNLVLLWWSIDHNNHRFPGTLPGWSYYWLPCHRSLCLFHFSNKLDFTLVCSKYVVAVHNITQNLNQLHTYSILVAFYISINVR